MKIKFRVSFQKDNSMQYQDVVINFDKKECKKFLTRGMYISHKISQIISTNAAAISQIC